MPGCDVVDLWVGLHRNLSGVQSLVGVTGVLLLSSVVLDLTTNVCNLLAEAGAALIIEISTCFTT